MTPKSIGMNVLVTSGVCNISPPHLNVNGFSYISGDIKLVDFDKPSQVISLYSRSHSC